MGQQGLALWKDRAWSWSWGVAGLGLAFPFPHRRTWLVIATGWTIATGACVSTGASESTGEDGRECPAIPARGASRGIVGQKSCVWPPPTYGDTPVATGRSCRDSARGSPRRGVMPGTAAPPRTGPAPSSAPCRDRKRSSRCAGRGGAGTPGRWGRGGRGAAGVPPGPAHCSAGSPGRPRPGSEHPLCWAAPGFVCGAAPGRRDREPRASGPGTGTPRTPRIALRDPPQRHRPSASPGPGPDRGCAQPSAPHRGTARLSGGDPRPGPPRLAAPLFR